MFVRRFDDPSEFLQRSHAFLSAAEVECGLLWDLARSLPRVPPSDCYLGVVEDHGRVVACALRTPPHKAIITRGPDRALLSLAADVSARYGTLPPIMGPEPDVTGLATRWAQDTGGRLHRGTRQRLLQATDVSAPPGQAPGVLRAGRDEDLPVLVTWVTAFCEDVALDYPGDPERIARDRVGSNRLFVWDNNGPVAMAAYAARTEHGARINFVYTPPAHRRRGYASAAVAALTRALLDQGLRFCCLYADLANPTSNRIYEAVGYRLVCHVSDYDFDNGDGSSPANGTAALPAP